MICQEHEDNKKRIAELALRRDTAKLTMQEALEIGEEITNLMYRQQELEDQARNDYFSALAEEEIQPMTRLCIIQESGVYFSQHRVESRIYRFVPGDDEEFGKQYCAKMNRKTDLPFYLAKVEVKLIGKVEEYTDERLIQEGIKPLD